MRRQLALGLVLGIAATSHRASAQTPAQPVIHGSAPAVSPDGSKIAFLSNRDGAPGVFVIGADGSNELRLTKTESEGQPAWSADGKAILFSVFGSDASRIYSVGLDGNAPRLLGSVPGRVLRVSQDGKTVLHWTGTWTAMKMFASSLDGLATRQLTEGNGVVWGARWSPDGTRIAFADRDASGNLHVFVIDADGSGRKQLTRLEAPDLREQMPAWSPDGSKLAVQAGAKGSPTHIWIVDVAPGAGRKIAPHTEPYQDEVPAWFPDGKRIAFQSDRTGRMEIWAMNADGTGQRQVTQ